MRRLVISRRWTSGSMRFSIAEGAKKNKSWLAWLCFVIRVCVCLAIALCACFLVLALSDEPRVSNSFRLCSISVFATVFVIARASS